MKYHFLSVSVVVLLLAAGCSSNQFYKRKLSSIDNVDLSRFLIFHSNSNQIVHVYSNELLNNTTFVSFQNTLEQSLEIQIPTASGSEIIFPNGEGLLIPVNDPFWTQAFSEGICYKAHEGLSFPAWGILSKGEVVSYFLPNELYSELCLKTHEGKIDLSLKVTVNERNLLQEFQIAFAKDKADILAPAKLYRQWLISKNDFKTLAERQKMHPEIEKLFGATHAYLWGDGRALDFLGDLKEMGIRKMVLSYDQDERNDKFIVSEDYIKKAKDQGYLVGKYDAFTNIQPANSVDNPVSDWGDLYPEGCIRNKDQSIKSGFGGRGCELSSQALKIKTEAPNYQSRIEKHIKSGTNQIFLDVDAFGSFHEDYHPLHSMTIAEDQQNRLARMRYISQTKNIILGSEQCTAWAVSSVDYCHGPGGTSFEFFWPLLKNKTRMGGWWPPERMGIFFKPLTLTANEDTAMFSYYYRIPLFQAVFHDSITSTDRWEFGFNKIKNIFAKRSLLALLYGVSPIWNLDRKELKTYKKELISLTKAYDDIHSVTATLPLVSFRWLTSNRSVQETQFGDVLVLTANFGKQRYQNINSNCLSAQWLKESQEVQYYCFTGF